MQALASPGRRADVGSMTSPPTGRRLLLAFLVAPLAAATPAYFALLAFGLVRRWTVWIGAATIGAATALALSPYLGKEFFRIQFPWWAGALVGLVSAEV